MLNLVERLIYKFSQQITDNTIDPSAVQPGQSVYDPSGEEFIILEDDPTSTNKVIMPAEDKGKEIPEGATTIDDSEFAATYQVQQTDGPTGPTTAKIEPEFIKGIRAKSS